MSEASTGEPRKRRIFSGVLAWCSTLSRPHEPDLAQRVVGGGNEAVGDAQAHRFIGREREEFAFLHHARDRDPLVHHRLGDAGISPSGLRRRADHGADGALDLLRCVRARPVHGCRGAHRRPWRHVDPVGGIRDERPRRDGVLLHDGHDRDRRRQKRLDDLVRRIDEAPERVHRQKHDRGRIGLRICQSPIDVVRQRRVDHAVEGDPVDGARPEAVERGGLSESGAAGEASEQEQRASGESVEAVSHRERSVLTGGTPCAGAVLRPLAGRGIGSACGVTGPARAPEAPGYVKVSQEERG